MLLLIPCHVERSPPAGDTVIPQQYHHTDWGEGEGRWTHDCYRRNTNRTPVGVRRRAPSREDMLVTTVAIDRATHRQLTLAAFDEHASINECVRDAIDEWLARRAVARGPRRAR